MRFAYECRAYVSKENPGKDKGGPRTPPMALCLWRTTRRGRSAEWLGTFLRGFANKRKEFFHHKGEISFRETVAWSWRACCVLWLWGTCNFVFCSCRLHSERALWWIRPLPETDPLGPAGAWVLIKQRKRLTSVLAQTGLRGAFLPAASPMVVGSHHPELQAPRHT